MIYKLIGILNEQEQQEDLREQIENGRKAKIALGFINDYLLQERATTIKQLETSSFQTQEEIDINVLYLRTLRKLEQTANTYIELGDIAEKDLNKYGK